MKINAYVLFCIMILSFVLISCNSIKKENLKPDSTDNSEISWEPVSRAYRVKGTIEDMNIKNDKVISIKIKVVKNLLMENNPVDYNFIGETVEIFFENMSVKQDKQNVIQSGEDIIISFEQYAKTDGTIIYGSLPEWIYIEKEGIFINLDGEEFEELQLMP